jgi:hypothetical protein
MFFERIARSATIQLINPMRLIGFVAGTINQQNIDIYALDSGGEMDPHGADGRGNPLGSLVYSNAFPSNNGNNNSFQQVIEWHKFVLFPFFLALFLASMLMDGNRNLALWARRFSASRSAIPP